MFETSNIAHVTPWVHFCRNQSVNLRNTVSEVRKTLFFDGLSGFLQLGVVLETSNIAHVTPRVHTFLGKKEFFKSVENFFLFGYTNTHTYKHTKSDQHKYCYLIKQWNLRKLETSDSFQEHAMKNMHQIQNINKIC